MEAKGHVGNVWEMIEWLVQRGLCDGERQMEWVDLCFDDQMQHPDRLRRTLQMTHELVVTTPVQPAASGVSRLCDPPILIAVVHPIGTGQQRTALAPHVIGSLRHSRQAR